MSLFKINFVLFCIELRPHLKTSSCGDHSLNGDLLTPTIITLSSGLSVFRTLGSVFLNLLQSVYTHTHTHTHTHTYNWKCYYSHYLVSLWYFFHETHLTVTNIHNWRRPCLGNLQWYTRSKYHCFPFIFCPLCLYAPSPLTLFLSFSLPPSLSLLLPLSLLQTPVLFPSSISFLLPHLKHHVKQHVEASLASESSSHISRCQVEQVSSSFRAYCMNKHLLAHTFRSSNH